MIILDIANNHAGNVERGIKIIESLAPLIAEFPKFTFAIKFQYRSPSILHLVLKTRTTERFRETMLNGADRYQLRLTAEHHGFKAGCTPFDEESAELVKSHGYDFCKVASCSLTDWPLLEKVATLGLPVTASTAGASDEDVLRAATFLSRRVPKLMLTLMHCVAEYPTPQGHQNLNRISELCSASISCFGSPDVGYSTHESPDEHGGCVGAVCKGATVLEWHVDLDDGRANSYSLTADQCRTRLELIGGAIAACEGKPRGEAEALLAIRRGVFVARDLQVGERLKLSDVQFQLPAAEGQLLANHWGKYNHWTVAIPGRAGSRVMRNDAMFAVGPHDTVVSMNDTTSAVEEAVMAVDQGLRAVFVPPSIRRPMQVTLSHHQGIANFSKVGAAFVEQVNNKAGYCKKLIVMLPGQQHPAHRHELKTETFIVVGGDLVLTVDGSEPVKMIAGQQATVQAGSWHSFRTIAGCVVEEVSTHSNLGDSLYMEPVDTYRKTEVWLP